MITIFQAKHSMTRADVDFQRGVGADDRDRLWLLVVLNFKKKLPRHDTQLWAGIDVGLGNSRDELVVVIC